MRFDVILGIILATVVGTIASFYVTRALQKRYPEVERPG